MYIDQWEHATTQVWPALGDFDGEDFRGYLQLYMSTTRTRLIPASNPEDVPDTGLLNKDPSQHIAGGRQLAVCLTSSVHPYMFSTMCLYSVVCTYCRLT